MAKKATALETKPTESVNLTTADLSRLGSRVLSETEKVFRAVQTALGLQKAGLGVITFGGASPFQSTTIDTASKRVKYTPSAWRMKDGATAPEYHVVAEHVLMTPKDLVIAAYVSLLSDLYWQENEHKPLFTRQDRYLSLEKSKFLAKYGVATSNLGTENGWANIAGVMEYDSRGLAVAKVVDEIAKKVDAEPFAVGARIITLAKARPQGATRSKYECPKCKDAFWASKEVKALCLKCNVEFVKAVKVPAGKRSATATATTASEGTKTATKNTK